MRTHAWLIIVGVTLLTAACGDSMSSLNPTAPSAVRGDVSAAEADDPNAVSGSMKNDKDKDKDKDKGKKPTNTSPGGVVPVPPGQSKVELEGMISEIVGATITVNEQKVTVTEDTVIRHGNRRFELEDLSVGDRVHVKATRVSITTGTGLAAVETLEATEVKLQNEGDEAEDDEDEDLPSVTVQASDSSAAESRNNTGTFRLSRSGSKWASTITVTFTLTGTATNGTDYANVPLTVTFQRGDDRVNVVVRPLADTATEGTETVILTLTPGSSYRLGSGTSATIRISDAASTGSR